MSSIPYYLLDQIFTHLPYESLVTCRAVSPLWNATILSRQVLRRKLFLQPPTPGIDEKIFRRRPISLHPVLRRLESDWAILNVPITITTAPSTERSPGDQPIAKPKLLHDSAVKDVFATEPALPEFVLMLPTHSLVVQRAGGVTVEDVANGVKKMYEDMAKTMGGNFVESW